LRYTAVEPDKHRFIPLECEHSMSLREILLLHPKGVEYADLLKGKPVYPLLLDRNGRTLSMPPIINSEDTKVTESTRNLLVDVTGFDEKTLEVILTIIVTNMAEVGGTIVQGEIHYS
ncbi:MAG: phenylalanine--tRNA ligase subunit beta, partial [Methanobacteriota archaeon]